MNLRGLLGALVVSALTMAIIYRVEPIRKIVIGA